MKWSFKSHRMILNQTMIDHAIILEEFIFIDEEIFNKEKER